MSNSIKTMRIAVAGASGRMGHMLIEAVLAQRLVRVLCPKCREEDKTPTTASFKMSAGIPANIPVYRAVGCRDCRNTGYHGRRAIFEWMDTSNEIRQLILKSSSSVEIRDAAKKGGMKTLADDGWRLVRQGVTTPEEVLRVTKDQSVGDASGDTSPILAVSPS